MSTTPEKAPLTEEYEEETFATSGCFSRFFCCGKRCNIGNNERISLLQGDYRETWWGNRFRQLKEFSELVSGPKWKTFIRRFNCHSNHNNNNKNRKPNFQYDPQSYALNFDGGADQEEDEPCRGFSARFVSPSGKYTGNLGRGPAGVALNR
ncbi:uncharacterized protein LOC131216908 [Magnolia sinica]|uniref:uncharacterized protein LOC131216908 n=1 Tax=Magnolia sinica TaxID=86752 RepID=UPI00265A6DF6|nr:uncharacterized protein LOC131216908 [Magnolia sinica]